jgi:hypothetical protein
MGWAWRVEVGGCVCGGGERGGEEEEEEEEAWMAGVKVR